MKTLFALIVLVLYVQSSCPFSKSTGGACPFANKETTEEGCICSTPCDGSLLNELARCDKCKTLNSCGKWSITGYYDYCVYPENRKYESQTAQQKIDEIWTKVKQSAATGPHHNVLKLLAMSVQTAFDCQWDEMPRERPKVIHSVGAVCKFSFQAAANSPYTGLWAPNARSLGIIRLGSAAEVTTSSGMKPGIGIKFLRSNVKSANFVALHTLEGLPNNSYNFFERDLSNHLPPAGGFLLPAIQKFKQASQCPFQVGLSDVCSYTFEGAKVERPVFPFKVAFRSPVIQIPRSPMTEADLLNHFRRIPVGTRLYDVYAFSTPRDAAANRSILLGTVVTTSECVSSKYGDTSLFFRHQRVEDDWKLRPEWLREIDPKICGQSELSLTPPKYCPSKV